MRKGKFIYYDKTPRIIQHGKSDENCYCRSCDFLSHTNALRVAKKHSLQTGHTVDVYYESWKEITCYKKP